MSIITIYDILEQNFLMRGPMKILVLGAGAINRVITLLVKAKKVTHDRCITS